MANGMFNEFRRRRFGSPQRQGSVVRNAVGQMPANVNTGAGPTRAAAQQDGKGGGFMGALGPTLSALMPMMGGMMGGQQQQQQPQPQQPAQQFQMNPIRPVDMQPALGGMLNKDIDLEQLLVMLLAGNGGGQSRGRNLRMGRA